MMENLLPSILPPSSNDVAEDLRGLCFSLAKPRMSDPGQNQVKSCTNCASLIFRLVICIKCIELLNRCGYVAAIKTFFSPENDKNIM